MKFIKNHDTTYGQTELSKALAQSLSAGQVLWLVSGGSNIPIEINVLEDIEDNLTKNLNILLADERWGPKGHPDSNYQQLMSAGLNLKKATFPDILEKNPSSSSALKLYSQLFRKMTNQSKKIIGQFGIGSDGHIAGVLPFSPAVSSTESVVFYETDQYKRLTLSLSAIKKVDIAISFCFGDSKSDALTRLREAKETTEILPALILRDIADSTVYNDLIQT